MRPKSWGLGGRRLTRPEPSSRATRSPGCLPQLSPGSDDKHGSPCANNPFLATGDSPSQDRLLPGNSPQPCHQRPQGRCSFPQVTEGQTACSVWGSLGRPCPPALPRGLGPCWPQEARTADTMVGPAASCLHLKRPSTPGSRCCLPRNENTALSQDSTSRVARTIGWAGGDTPHPLGSNHAAGEGSPGTRPTRRRAGRLPSSPTVSWPRCPRGAHGRWRGPRPGRSARSRTGHRP